MKQITLSNTRSLTFEVPDDFNMDPEDLFIQYRDDPESLKLVEEDNREFEITEHKL